MKHSETLWFIDSFIDSTQFKENNPERQKLKGSAMLERLPRVCVFVCLWERVYFRGWEPCLISCSNLALWSIMPNPECIWHWCHAEYLLLNNRAQRLVTRSRNTNRKLMWNKEKECGHIVAVAKEPDKSASSCLICRPSQLHARLNTTLFIGSERRAS